MAVAPGSVAVVVDDVAAAVAVEARRTYWAMTRKTQRADAVAGISSFFVFSDDKSEGIVEQAGAPRITHLPQTSHALTRHACEGSLR